MTLETRVRKALEKRASTLRRTASRVELIGVDEGAVRSGFAAAHGCGSQAHAERRRHGRRSDVRSGARDRVAGRWTDSKTRRRAGFVAARRSRRRGVRLHRSRDAQAVVEALT